MASGEQVVVGLGAGSAAVGDGRDLPTQEMVLNIGPQHPATHGVLRLRLVLDGERIVDIAPGTQPGDTITLKGLGVTRLRSEARGDLVVHANVRTPTRLDGHQEELLRQFAAARGEEQPAANFQPMHKGLFGKLRDAFAPR